MRATRGARTQLPRLVLTLTAALVGALALVGCAADTKRTNLTEGFASLNEGRHDAAQQAADRVLANAPAGPGVAEALYLRGRVFEERSKVEKDPVRVRQQLAEARAAYLRALSLKPPAKLEASVRAQLTNVAYFQEDFPTAVREGTAALPGMATPNDQAWVLYRVAQSQQRLGRFGDADRNFAAVQRQFPGTDPAKGAAARQGATAFHVQVGIFKDAANADRAVAALSADGYPAVRSRNGTGQQIIGVGPIPTYQQAKAMQARLVNKYPDAIILP